MTDEKKALQEIGFIGLLILLFMTLKLCDVIAWSWWLVLMPLYAIPFLLIMAWIVCCICGVIVDKFEQSKYFIQVHTSSRKRKAVQLELIKK